MSPIRRNRDGTILFGSQVSAPTAATTCSVHLYQITAVIQDKIIPYCVPEVIPDISLTEFPGIVQKNHAIHGVSEPRSLIEEVYPLGTEPVLVQVLAIDEPRTLVEIVEEWPIQGMIEDSIRCDPDVVVGALMNKALPRHVRIERRGFGFEKIPQFLKQVEEHVPNVINPHRSVNPQWPKYQD
jgi:hypothetical protein